MPIHLSDALPRKVLEEHMYSKSVKLATAMAAVVVVMAALALPLAAQNRIIKGKITNESGQAVQGAQVWIQGTDVKREYTVKSDKKGEYFYMGIPFGEYRVIVRAQGYFPDYAQ